MDTNQEKRIHLIEIVREIPNDKAPFELFIQARAEVTLTRPDVIQVIESHGAIMSLVVERENGAEVEYEEFCQLKDELVAMGFSEEEVFIALSSGRN